MSQETRQDGPYFIDQMVATMGELCGTLPGLSPTLSPEAQGEVAERLQRLVDMLVPIRKKLFVKTQGGSEMARQCAVEVTRLKETMLALAGGSQTVEPGRLEEAIKSAEAKIEPFVDKTQNLIIRMT